MERTIRKAVCLLHSDPTALRGFITLLEGRCVVQVVLSNCDTPKAQKRPLLYTVLDRPTDTPSSMCAPCLCSTQYTRLFVGKGACVTHCCSRGAAGFPFHGARGAPSTHNACIKHRAVSTISKRQKLGQEMGENETIINVCTILLANFSQAAHCH